MTEADENDTGTDPVSSSAVKREAGDDFFCHRYGVWYPSFDCAIRTRFRTAPGCLRCDQGRFNAKRHADAMRGIRWRLAVSD